MPALPSLYNSLTRQLEPIVPIKPGQVGIYCCGPTVYDVPHVGHARAALAPDLLVRRLRALGLRVNYVRNITDVEDKILERSKKNGETPNALAERMAAVYQREVGAVGCVPPDHEPRVSAHIPQILELIAKLVAHGNAYVVDMPEGVRDVYFAVRSFPDYGKLSRRKIDELVAGARVEAGQEKHDPLDFALWKGTTADEWGWDSEFGRGRPGWHIECSAMCTHYLGQPFDVHTGGMDLIFPHHENEIAQSEAAEPDQRSLARIWIHNGFVNCDKEKMSKSLGNFVTIGQVFERNDPEALRCFLLGAHYRGPIQFDTQTLPDGRVVFPGVDEAERQMDHAFLALARASQLLQPDLTAPAKLPAELLVYREHTAAAVKSAEAALDDDLNTPVALAHFYEITRMAHELSDLAARRRKDAAFVASAGITAEHLLSGLRRLAEQLGLLQIDAPTYNARARERRLTLRKLSAATIDALVAERSAARAAKDFARGDAIRAELTALGVSIHDSPTGTEWTISQ